MQVLLLQSCNRRLVASVSPLFLCAQTHTFARDDPPSRYTFASSSRIGTVRGDQSARVHHTTCCNGGTRTHFLLTANSISNRAHGMVSIVRRDYDFMREPESVSSNYTEPDESLSLDENSFLQYLHTYLVLSSLFY
jgi:hypothetical protein